LEGLVLQSTGSWYETEVEGRRVQARLRGKLRQTIQGLSNPVAVGDRVRLLPDPERGDYSIEEVLPRSNYIIRRSPKNKHHKHILAANLDQAVLVVTLSKPRTSLGFIDRFVVNAGTYHIPTVLVFNKADQLSSPERVRQQEIAELYEGLGYRCLLSSAKSGEGLEELRALLAGRTSLLAGHSGVGKSSLANALEPGLGLRVREISASSGKGLHTTTFATLHPLAMGGYVLDTPGIKEFGIVDLEREEVGHYFPEFVERMEHCRFHNCLHLGEPDCAVLAALEEGEIAGSRYDSYRSILEDAAAPDWE
jgi:ribosome biogenesis GTPase / thiamine phosphate phosphatase